MGRQLLQIFSAIILVATFADAVVPAVDQSLVTLQGGKISPLNLFVVYIYIKLLYTTLCESAAVAYNFFPCR